MVDTMLVPPLAPVSHPRPQLYADGFGLNRATPLTDVGRPKEEDDSAVVAQLFTNVFITHNTQFNVPRPATAAAHMETQTPQMETQTAPDGAARMEVDRRRPRGSRVAEAVRQLEGQTTPMEAEPTVFPGGLDFMSAPRPEFNSTRGHRAASGARQRALATPEASLREAMGARTNAPPPPKREPANPVFEAPSGLLPFRTAADEAQASAEAAAAQARTRGLVRDKQERHRPRSEAKTTAVQAREHAQEARTAAHREAFRENEAVRFGHRRPVQHLPQMVFKAEGALRTQQPAAMDYAFQGIPIPNFSHMFTTVRKEEKRVKAELGSAPAEPETPKLKRPPRLKGNMARRMAESRMHDA